MRFRIHGTTPCGDEDSIIIEGETLEEIRQKASTETGVRNWTNLWSENLDEQ